MSDIFFIGEFFSIAFITIITYMTIHAMLGHLKPATKALVSMFFGTVAYSFGKVMLITLIMEPFFSKTTF